MDDLEFVQRCVKGDKQTWDEFLDKYSRLIYNYPLHVLNTKGFAFAKEQVNDIFQEVFCSLIEDNYRKLKSFRARNGCSLASWLRQVTINFTIDYLRKIKPTISIDEEIDEENKKRILLISICILIGILGNMTGYELFYWSTPYILFCFICGLIQGAIKNLSSQKT